MHGPVLDILFCMILWGASWGGFFFLLHEQGVDYTRYFLWTSAYFLLVALIAIGIFWKDVNEVVSGFVFTPFSILTVFMMGNILVYLYLPRLFEIPESYFVQYPYREYLKLDPRRLVSKSMDIFAQQVFVVVLVISLARWGLPLYQILIGFGLLFGCMHIPLIMRERGQWPAWTFGGIVLVFSTLFPLLILKVHYGFVYSYVAHWSFYTVMAVLFTLWRFRST